jgi:hypothetical protein
MVGIWSVLSAYLFHFNSLLGMVCFMGDVNNFAANNMVSLDEIKDKFTSEENRPRNFQ